MTRLLIIILLFTPTFPADAQTFIAFRDTINKFSINIPVGWKYGVNKDFPSLALIALRTTDNPAESSRDNFNINIINTAANNLQNVFTDIVETLSEAADFKLIDKGDTTINDIPFKWLIETHKNFKNGVKMLNYDFVTIRGGKAYVLTLVTYADTFEVVKPLFDKIAGSFRIWE